MLWKVSVVAIVTIVFLYELFLTLLSLRSKNNPIPPCVSDVYDPESYQKHLSYRAEKSRLELLRSSAGYLIDVVLLLTNAYAAFSGLFFRGTWVQLLAVVLLSAVSSLLLLPFEYCDTMGIEQKYGFNRTDKKTFVLDRIKEFALQFVLMLGLASLIMGLHLACGDCLDKCKHGALEYKTVPLADRSADRVQTAALTDRYAHRRETAALTDRCADRREIEICAVFAHELGHGLHKDTLKNQLLSFLQMLILGALAWLTLRTPELFTAFGFSEVNYGFALLLIMSVEFALIQPLFGLLANAFSRRAEYRADAHAASEGYGEALISGLKKLSRQNFANLSPSPLLVALTYSHPTLAQRIEAIRKTEQNA